MRNRLGKRECCAALGRERRLTGSLRSPETANIKQPCPAGNRGATPVRQNAVSAGRGIAAPRTRSHLLRSRLSAREQAAAEPNRRDDAKEPAENDQGCGSAAYRSANKSLGVPRHSRITSCNVNSVHVAFDEAGPPPCSFDHCVLAPSTTLRAQAADGRYCSLTSATRTRR
jgi:hypothetical protein